MAQTRSFISPVVNASRKSGILARSGCVNNQPALCRVMLSDFNIATQIDFAHFIFKAKCSQKCFKNEMFVLQKNHLAGPRQLLGRLTKWGAGWGNQEFQPWLWGCQQDLTSWFDLQFLITFLGSGLWQILSVATGLSQVLLKGACISSSWGCCPVVTLGPAALSPPVPSLALPSPLCLQPGQQWTLKSWATKGITTTTTTARTILVFQVLSSLSVTFSAHMAGRDGHRNLWGSTG